MYKNIEEIKNNQLTIEIHPALLAQFSLLTYEYKSPVYLIILAHERGDGSQGIEQDQRLGVGITVNFAASQKSLL